MSGAVATGAGRCARSHLSRCSFSVSFFLYHFHVYVFLFLCFVFFVISTMNESYIVLVQRRNDNPQYAASSHWRSEIFYKPASRSVHTWIELAEASLLGRLPLPPGHKPHEALTKTTAPVAQRRRTQPGEHLHGRQADYSDLWLRSTRSLLYSRSARSARAPSWCPTLT